MKLQVFLLIITIHAVDTFIPARVIADTNEFVSAKTWLERVQKAREYGSSWGEFLSFEPALLQDYLNHFLPETAGERYWKLQALAQYGGPNNQEELHQLADRVQQDFPELADLEVTLDVLKLAIPARHGDKRSLARIHTLVKTDLGAKMFAPPILYHCSSPRARKILYEMSTDTNLPVAVRMDCAKWLCRTGDKRCLDVLLSKEMHQDLAADSMLSPSALNITLERLSGDRRFREVTSDPEQLRKFIKNNTIQILEPRTILSVKGGINWQQVKE